MDGLTAFQRDILYIIGGKNKPHGLEIKTELESYYQNDVNHGRLYPNLDQLAEQGLIRKGEYDKRTNKYTLTEDGKQVIQARREWEDNHLANAAERLS